MPIGHQIMRNPIKPSLKGQALLDIIADMRQRAEENFGCQILRIMDVARPIIDIAVNLRQIALIEFAKSFLVLLSQRDQFAVSQIRVIDAPREWILHSVVL